MMDRLITVFSIILGLLVILTAIFSFQIMTIKPQRVDRVEMTMKVGDVIGLAGDKDKLNFGTIKPGSSVQKSINITSDKSVQAELNVIGSIAPYVRLNNDIVVLAPGVSEEIFITVRVPSALDSGNFTGELVVRYTNVKGTS